MCGWLRRHCIRDCWMVISATRNSRAFVSVRGSKESTERYNTSMLNWRNAWSTINFKYLYSNAQSCTHNFWFYVKKRKKRNYVVFNFIVYNSLIFTIMLILRTFYKNKWLTALFAMCILITDTWWMDECMCICAYARVLYQSLIPTNILII